MTDLDKFAEWLDCVADLRCKAGEAPISAAKALPLFKDEWTAGYVASLSMFSVDQYGRIHAQAQKTARYVVLGEKA
jgi:hypothetical protein